MKSYAERFYGMPLQVFLTKENKIILAPGPNKAHAINVVKR